MRYTIELGDLGTARIIGWGVIGTNPRTHDIEITQYDPDESWRANEHAMRLDKAILAPII